MTKEKISSIFQSLVFLFLIILLIVKAINTHIEQKKVLEESKKYLMNKYGANFSLEKQDIRISKFGASARPELIKTQNLIFRLSGKRNEKDGSYQFYDTLIDDIIERDVFNVLSKDIATKLINIDFTFSTVKIKFKTKFHFQRQTQVNDDIKEGLTNPKRLKNFITFEYIEVWVSKPNDDRNSYDEAAIEIIEILTDFQFETLKIFFSEQVNNREDSAYILSDEKCNLILEEKSIIKNCRINNFHH